MKQVDPLTLAYMDQTYPGWEAHLVAMTLLASIWLGKRIYHAESEATLTRLRCVYDELYLAVTNTTPNKPPLMDGGKEITV